MKNIIHIVFLCSFLCPIVSAQIPYSNPNWNDWYEIAALVKNNGDEKFTVVQEGEANIAFSVSSNAVFFDYDNDGNLDLLLVGKGGGWRVRDDLKFARLYRNMGEEGSYLFKEVYNTGLKQYNDEMYFNTISIGDYDHDGYNDVLIMCYDDKGRSIDLYKNNAGDGTFTIQQNAIPQAGHEVKETVFIDPDNPDLGTKEVVFNKFFPASNGSVMFGDLDNDGWLDIFYTGYSNSARGIRTYRNMQDGTFKDVTPVDDISGAFQSQSVLADINGDGALDIMVTGHIEDWKRVSSIYYNIIDPVTGKQQYQLKDSDETGIHAANKANVLVADFNNDGLMDIVMNGDNGNDSRNRVFYQKTDGTFMLDENYPLFPTREGGLNMGDINGDGNMDLILSGYKNGDGYDSPVHVYENRPSENGLKNNLPPSAPAAVDAGFENGKLKITWEPSTDDISVQKALRYNIFVRNNVTGKIWMMIPADISTGRVKVGTDLQTSLSSHIKEYEIPMPLPDDYTIGVQALDQAYAGSKFITVTKNFTSITPDVAKPGIFVRATGEGILVDSELTEVVEVVSITGQKIAKGTTNKVIPVNNSGVYIVVVNGIVIKVIR